MLLNLSPFGRFAPAKAPGMLSGWRGDYLPGRFRGQPEGEPRLERLAAIILMEPELFNGFSQGFRHR